MNVLIVSFRNTCRGPMAGALARRIASQHSIALDVAIAGTAQKGSVAALAVEAMANISEDISQHHPQQLTAQMLEWADVVVALDADLGLGLRLQYPDAADKIIDLGADVPDPRRPGATLDDFVACRDQLDTLLRRLPIYAPHNRAYQSAGLRFPARGRAARPQAGAASRSGVS
jgi:protein-tyrosine-phosphatase